MDYTSISVIPVLSYPESFIILDSLLKLTGVTICINFESKNKFGDNNSLIHNFLVPVSTAVKFFNFFSCPRSSSKKF